LIKGKMDCWKECYLCGGKDFKKRSGSVRDSSELEVLECAACGLVFLSSFDHVENDFYKKSQMHGEEMPEVLNWLKETLWDDERRFQYLKALLPNCRTLDFGCGAGGFLLKAQELSSTAHGVEPELRLKRYFENSGLTVFNNLSEILQDAQGGNYDLITMFHVLEHIPDPKAILGELSDFLGDGGSIIVEVPNADDALLSLYRCEPFSHFTYWSCHLFLFTSKTLTMLFTQMNLKVNYIRQVQRYPLANHLYWLTNGKPGGHQKWNFLDSPDMHTAYEKELAAIGKCDTILASVSTH